MNEEILNANEPEVVQPEDNAAENAAQDSADSRTEQAAAAVAEPRNIDDMSDDEFTEYLKQVQDGDVPAAETETPQDKPTDTGDTAPEDTADEVKPYKVFKTHADYQKEFDGIMGERLKKNRESMELLDRLKVQARNFYGDADDDTAAVNALIADLTNQNAEKRGVETDEYNRITRDAEDARKWREQQTAQKTKQDEIDAIQAAWRKGEEDLRRVVPDFNFEKAMRNKTFNDAIMQGASVQTAYMTANKANAKPKRQPVKQVGMQSGVSGKSDYDPSSLPADDFDAYIRRIMNR